MSNDDCHNPKRRNSGAKPRPVTGYSDDDFDDVFVDLDHDINPTDRPGGDFGYDDFDYSDSYSLKDTQRLDAVVGPAQAAETPSRHERGSSSSYMADHHSAETRLSTESQTSGSTRRNRRKEKPPKSPARNLIEWLVVMVLAVSAALLIRTFVVQTFWIPSGSMTHTLETGDRVLVNKLAYKFGDPKRGDVVVFKRPANDPGAINDLIKRVIAVEGDRVSIRDEKVYINGKAINESYTSDRPTLPNVGCGAGDTQGIDTPEGMVVPDQHLFVMGDNRTNSMDSRCFGPIEKDSLVGKAFVVIWPPGRAGGI